MIYKVMDYILYVYKYLSIYPYIYSIYVLNHLIIPAFCPDELPWYGPSFGEEPEVPKISKHCDFANKNGPRWSESNEKEKPWFV